MADRGWTGDRARMVAYKLGYLLVDRHESGDSAIPDANELATALGESVNVVRQAAGLLEQDGVVRTIKAFAGPLGMMITDHGLTTMLQIRAKAAVASTRRVACREALLEWIYESEEIAPQRMLHDFHQDARSSIFGDSFSEHEVEAAATYLIDAGLIKREGAVQRETTVASAKSIAMPLTVAVVIEVGRSLFRRSRLPVHSLAAEWVRITHQGIICVEDFHGDIRTFKQRAGNDASGTNANAASGSSGIRQKIRNEPSAETPDTATGLSDARYGHRVALIGVITAALIGAIATVVAALLS